ncbi:hypothetical protein J6590_054041 [Homalodisca vitripennis]|nr:hypothetical protein J6590_054041 [Homalodisca vitripennis]
MYVSVTFKRPRSSQGPTNQVRLLSSYPILQEPCSLTIILLCESLTQYSQSAVCRSLSEVLGQPFLLTTYRRCDLDCLPTTAKDDVIMKALAVVPELTSL